MKIERKIRLIKEFGWKCAFYDFCASNIRIPKVTARWKDRVLLDWLKKNYGDLILKYKNFSLDASTVNVNYNEKVPVWSMWWQGEDNTSDLVKLCFSKMRRYCENHPVNIITKYNYHEYIDLPEYIIKKVDSGAITLTHLSDIVRMCLLARYGGIWIDSTILITDYVNEEIFKSEYFTIKHEFNVNDYCVQQGRWVGCLIAAHKGNILCSFAKEVLFEYWKKHKSLVDYVLIDYVIAFAYENLQKCKTMIDSVPKNNCNFYKLQPLLNLTFNQNLYETLKADTHFFKLTYKHDFKKMRAGQETFYGHLLKT